MNCTRHSDATPSPTLRPDGPLATSWSSRPADGASPRPAGLLLFIDEVYPHFLHR
jgi:hypothetical protein